jgi:hypothetical protein
MPPSAHPNSNPNRPKNPSYPQNNPISLRKIILDQTVSLPKSQIERPEKVAGFQLGNHRFVKNAATERVHWLLQTAFKI